MFKRKYTFDYRYFSTIGCEQKAYWLGFLAADGSVLSKRNTVQLALKTADQDHVLQFGKDINSNYPVKNYTNNGSGYATVSITAKELISDLAVFGVTARKTSTVFWPNLPDDMLRHYIRGYFDGDGCFWANTKRCSYSILGNEPFLNDLQSHLRTKLGLGAAKLFKRYPSCPVSHFHYCGKKNCPKIYHYLYENASTYLLRKKQRAESAFEFFGI